MIKAKGILLLSIAMPSGTTLCITVITTPMQYHTNCITVIILHISNHITMYYSPLHYIYCHCIKVITLHHCITSIALLLSFNNHFLRNKITFSKLKSMLQKSLFLKVTSLYHPDSPVEPPLPFQPPIDALSLLCGR